MEPSPSFSTYAADRTQGFTGRKWVFDAVDQWLGQPNGSRFFLLTGEPGSGKTAVAGRLFQFASAAIPARQDEPHLEPGFLAASHFCSARDAGSVDPRGFTRSLFQQLQKAEPTFAGALIASSDRRIDIKVDQQIGQVGPSGQVTGVVIKNLDLSGLLPQDGFNRSVLDPLHAIYDAGFDEQITILVDALDESLTYKGDVTIVRLLSGLRGLPSKVRFIITSRPEVSVLREFQDADGLSLSGAEFDKLNLKDISGYVRNRLGGKEFAGGAGLASEQAAPLAEKIAEKSEGNFQFVTFLLNAMAKGQRPLDDLDGLPQGLDGLYLDSLGRVVDLGNKDWARDYSPVMGVLSVGQGSLTASQLQALTNQTEEATWNAIVGLQQFIEEAKGNGDTSESSYRLYHQSVVDFLERRQVGEKRIINPYYLSPAAWHRRIADYYLDDRAGDWKQWDDYGLRYAASHLAESIRGAPAAEVHSQTERLVSLVTNSEFQNANIERIGDLAALRRDLVKALRCAVADRDAGALPLVVESALNLVKFRHELRPESVFELASKGQVESARRRLSLFDVESDWLQASLLAIAWLASAASPAEARKLRDQVAGLIPPSGALPRLLDLLNAELEHTPLAMGVLPPPPPQYLAAAIVERLGGGSDAELLSTRGLGMVPAAPPAPEWQSARELGMSPSTPPLVQQAAPGVPPPASPAPFVGKPGQALDRAGYLAEQDGPRLVAFAAAQPAEGDRYFKQYLAIHSSYNYVQYRNRSLWMLLEAALQHPDQAWVKATLPQIASAALAGSRLDFQESLRTTLLGIMSFRQLPDAARLFEVIKGRALAEAAAIRPNQVEGDPLGRCKRRLASLAEVHSRVFGDPATAAVLLDKAMGVPRGFAGFGMPTLLTLAESILVCGPLNVPLIDKALQFAQEAAHNIQDHFFCARSTSRLNAMRNRWWTPALPDARQSAKRLATDGAPAPEFAALHEVGEAYGRRVLGPQSLILPDWMREASTLRSLSLVYNRPVSEFLELNAELGSSPDATLAPGTEVNVPDRGFSTLLAARVAAGVLADPGLGPDEQAEVIKSLAPVAADNPTALDTVLARLLLAAGPAIIPPVLDRLNQIVTQYSHDQSSDLEVNQPPGLPI
jgi:hypothetical protein